eukprot:2451342-Prymnesium_polylepis.1
MLPLPATVQAKAAQGSQGTFACKRLPIFESTSGESPRTAPPTIYLHVWQAYLRNLTDPYELSDTLMWWETIECLRKMVLVGLFIFIAYGTVEQLVGGIVTSLVFTVLYNNFKPYDSWENDLLQQVCQLALFFMLLAALMLRYEEAVSTDEAWSPKDDEDLGWALLIVTSLIPLLAFFMTAIYDRRLLFDRARRVWRTLKRMRYPSFYIDAAKKSADSSLSFVRKAKTLAWVTSTVLAPLLS